MMELLPKIAHFNATPPRGGGTADAGRHIYIFRFYIANSKQRADGRTCKHRYLRDESAQLQAISSEVLAH